ncbi:MAG TPA: GNAT family N-acetyltransferase [Polyangiaceae bacterium]
MHELRTEDADWASGVLEQAFRADPMVNFVFGEEPGAPGRVNWFFKALFRYATLYGGCSSTPDKDGVLMMLPPAQAHATFGKMCRAGILSAPRRMGWAPVSRFMKVSDFVEKEHKAAAPFEHFYVMMMGVLPDRQGMGVGRALLTQALATVDTHKLPCYLETQNESNVAIYERFGFALISEKEMPNGGLRSWGMLREKR